MNRNRIRNVFFIALVSTSLLTVLILIIKISYDDHQAVQEVVPIITPIPFIEPEPIDEPNIPIENTVQEVNPSIDDIGLPYDKLFITVERQNYQSGDLTLIIPKLNLNESIEDGTEAESLNKGPGLYDYSQLPGYGNRNVSIAAHRNTSRNGIIGVWFFYYIDTLTTGDYLYLIDQDNIYRYTYNQTTVVDPYDWGPIYSQGFSCLTLTSCEPIGISTHRIIVQSKLSEIYPNTIDFEFTSNSGTLH